jgi:hypothetical protein
MALQRGNPALLLIPTPGGFTYALPNSIAGFAIGDMLDLTGLGFVSGDTTATLNGTNLTVTNGSATDIFILTGAAPGTRFATAADGNGTSVQETTESTVPTETLGGPHSGNESTTISLGSAVSVSANPRGLSRDWGDDDESDTICRARCRRGDRGCGGFWGWLEPGPMARRALSTLWSSTGPTVLRISPTWV